MTRVIQKFQKNKNLDSLLQIKESRLQGRNSKLYQLDYGDYKWALKIYTSADNKDRKGRLHKELSLLEHASRSASTQSCPKVMEYSEKDSYVVMEWIEGVRPKTLTTDIEDKSISFIQAINEDRETKIAFMGNAKESLVDIKVFIDDIENRIRNLREALDNISEYMWAIEWIDEELIPAKLKEEKKADMQTKNWWWKESWDSIKIVSPSDMGIHNMIISEKQLWFVDFEYSGYDDLAKLVGDFIVQPNHQMTRERELEFIEKIKKAGITKSTGWYMRLKDIKKLLIIKWTLIIAGISNDKNINKNRLESAKEYFSSAQR